MNEIKLETEMQNRDENNSTHNETLAPKNNMQPNTQDDIVLRARAFRIDLFLNYYVFIRIYKRD